MTSILDTSDSVAYPTLAIDSTGRVHIAYRDTQNRRLRYAYRSPEGWTAETFGADDGLQLAIATDRLGGVHISYQGRSSRVLRYAHRSPDGSWTDTIVDDSSTDVGRDSSIVVDDDLVVHISYLEARVEEYLRHAERDSTGTWTTRTVGPAGVDFRLDEAAPTSIALGPDDDVHISYRSGGQNLRHAQRVAGRWSSEAVETPAVGRVAESSSIGVDALGRIHIGYDFSDRETIIRHAMRDRSGEWTLTDVASTGRPVLQASVSLSVDDLGGVHIGHRNSGVFYFYRPLDGEWTTYEAVADVPVMSDGTISLSVDSTGAHMVFVEDNAIDTLYYTHGRVCP